MKLDKKLYKCKSYWPRSNPRSTVDYNDRLETVYCVWSNPNATPVENAMSIVFVHGSQCVKEIFEYHAQLFFEKLGTRLNKCIGIDIVSHGDSAIVNHDKLGIYMGWDDVARDVGLVVHDCIDTRGINGPFMYVGHSMGGMSGLLLATYEPGLFECVAPLDPVFFDDYYRGESLERFLKERIGLMKLISKSPNEYDSWEAYEDFYRNRFCRNWDSHVKDAFVAASAVKCADGIVRTKGTKTNHMSAYLSGVAVYTAYDSILKFLKVPVLVLYATAKSNLTTTPGSRLTKVIDDCQAVGIDAGHNFPYEKPVETVDIIVPFFLKNWNRTRWHRAPIPAGEIGAWQMELAQEIIEFEKKMLNELPKSRKYPAKF